MPDFPVAESQLKKKKWSWKPKIMDVAKAALKRKFIAINACIWKERSQINNLTFHLRELEKEEQNKPKTRRREKIIKVNQR